MKPRHPAEIGAAVVRSVDELADAANEALPAQRRLAGGYQALTEDEALAIGRWLARFADSPGFFDDCFDEAVRFLYWGIYVRGASIGALTRKDALAFKIYLSTAKRGLSPERRRLAFQVAVGLRSALADTGSEEAAPGPRPMLTGKVRTRSGDRLPTAVHWNEVLRHIGTLPSGTLRERQHFERLRWVLRFLHQTGLAASAAAEVRANDFLQRRGRWRLRVRTPATVERELVVGDQLIADFQRYRAFLGLAADSLALDAGPAIRTITGKWERFLTPASIQLMVKGVFSDAAIALEAADPMAASELRRAYLCWVHQADADHRKVADRIDPAS